MFKVEPVGEKVLIVEGKTDRERLEQVLREPVSFVCTRGTIGYEELLEIAERLEDEDVYVFVDADESGMKLRKQLRRELPRAKHVYTQKMYREVARTPLHVLAKALANAHFDVDPKWLTEVDHRP
ncbi:toprim domain-containing protein [Alicyclobacillus sp. ALC3]|uniref:toprim domain-containing protein n=1 Tax=Alicyclobacillus sp. ALC3 TaxID=2796143 RepID=UPI0023786995|nr:toprim domain-containing protein [Alicyclobacillus sp. ALC3]WDL95439.1 toprim domain-containing protein [Alicyclobacillus sp. ALC3]